MQELRRQAEQEAKNKQDQRMQNIHGANQVTTNTVNSNQQRQRYT